MSWAYVIEDPFAVSRIGAALIRWMIDVFWILILDGMMKQQSVLTLKRGQKLIFWTMPILSVIFLISLLIIGDYYVRWNGLGLCIWFSRKVKKQAQESLIFYFLLFFAGILSAMCYRFI